MILHTIEVTPLPEYRLAVRFNNGVAGEVSLADELSGEVFESLRDPALFATAYQHPAMRTVAWANGADLAPEFLPELMRRQVPRTSGLGILEISPDVLDGAFSAEVEAEVASLMAGGSGA